MNSPARRFQDLVVWQKAHALVLEIYRLTREFPPEERFGLSSQMRRAAVSVPANIAEGFRKRGTADKARFMNIAQGSLDEVQYHLILAQDLKYADCHELLSAQEEVSKMLNAYERAILDSRS